MERRIKCIDDAIAQGTNITLHGSIELVARCVEILEQWEKIGYYDKVDKYGNTGEFAFLFDVLAKDPKLMAMEERDELRRRQEHKENVRRIGHGKTTLFNWEMYNLEWLLEIQEKNLGGRI
jgi:hypothetical protein